MRASKWLTGLFVFIAAAGLVLGVVFEVGQARIHRISMSERLGVDGRLRLAEIDCAHLGVNSFHIWNRDVALSGFCPLHRPDKSSVCPARGDRIVHAYPVWHNAYFYFLGWFSTRCAEVVLLCLLGLSMFYILKEFCADAQDIPCRRVPFVTGVLMLATMPICCCFLALNYSVLVFACWIAVAKSCTRKNQFWAGVVWGLSMIKPQMALLLFWPLFFQKRYLTIVIAMATCIIATLGMSFRYAESPIDLILQIPQIGAPYTSGHLQRALGHFGLYLQPSIFFIVCGFLSYKLRAAEKWYVRFAPAALCTVVWTYCLWCDRVVLCVWFCVVAHKILMSRDFRRWWIFYGAYTIVSGLFIYFWESFSIVGIFNASGLGWLYYGVLLTWILMSFMCLFGMARAARITLPPRNN